MGETEKVDRRKSEPRGADKKRKRIRILIACGVAVCGIALAAIILPRHVARYVVAGELDKMGIVHQGVDTLDVDLWAQEVTFGPLKFRASESDSGQVGQFALKLRLANLLSRRAVVEHIIVDGIDLKVYRTKAGAISINGVALQDFVAKKGGEEAPAAEEDPWHAALEKLQLRNSRVMLRQEGAGELAVTVARLDLSGFRTWEPDRPGTFDLEATANGIGFKARGEARPFADKITLAIETNEQNVEIAKIEKFIGPLGLERRAGVSNSRFKHDISLHADGRIDVASKGRVDIAKVDIALADRVGLRNASATLEIDAGISLLANNAFDVRSKLTAVLRDVSAVTPDGISVTAKELKLGVSEMSGKLRPGGSAPAGTPATPDTSGTPATPDTSGTPATPDTSGAPATPNASGMPATPAPAATPATPQVGANKAPRPDFSFALAGTTGLNGVAVVIPPTGARPATDIGVSSMRVSVGEAAVSSNGGLLRWKTAFSFAINDLATKIAKGKAADVRIGTVKANGVQADQTLALTMKEFLVGGLKAALTDKIIPAPPPANPGAQTKAPANPGGQAKAPANPGAQAKAPPPADPGAQAKTPAARPKIIIGRVAFLDRGDISFKDASVTPEVDLKVVLETLELLDVNSGDPAQKSPLRLKAKINEFTNLEVGGWAAPFGAKPDFSLKAKVTGLELPRFSPYAAKAVGMNLESGQLNLDASATGKQAVLDAKLDLNLRDLEFGDLSPEDAKKLEGAVGMPIQTAIGFLQDSDKAINLSIPILGTIQKPEIDLSDAIQQAVGGALTSLFPPTAIASMLISAGKGGVKFKPVPFKPGTAKLDVAGKALAKNIAELMAKRPKLSLRVCGRATSGDLANFTARLIEQRRAAQRLAEAAKVKSQGAAKSAPKKGAPAPAATATATATAKIVLPDRATILKSARTPMNKLATDRTRAIRAFISGRDKALNGRISECRSAFNPKDKKAPRANVTL